MRYVDGTDEHGEAIEVCDPLLSTIQTAVKASAQGEARVMALLGIDAIFGKELPLETRFVKQVTEAYLSLLAKGAKATVAEFAAKL